MTTSDKFNGRLAKILEAANAAIGTVLRKARSDLPDYGAALTRQSIKNGELLLESHTDPKPDMEEVLRDALLSTAEKLSATLPVLRGDLKKMCERQVRKTAAALAVLAMDTGKREAGGPFAQLQIAANRGDFFSPDLSGYAAQDAARLLLDNWSAAIFDGNIHGLARDVDRVIDQLRLFRRAARKTLNEVVCTAESVARNNGHASPDSCTTLDTFTVDGHTYDLRVCMSGSDAYFEFINEDGDPVGDIFDVLTSTTKNTFASQVSVQDKPTVGSVF